MAAVPKGKRSKSKRDMKRNGFKLGVLSIVECPRCRAKKVAHRICIACGYYDNKEVIKIKDKSKEKTSPEAKAKAKEKAKNEAKAAKGASGRGRKPVTTAAKETKEVKETVEAKETEPVSI